ncbi:MAG TPA: hypothetical protein VGX03_07135, partial [Candidatus Binatia bacterium]|nr:hypothetical protein [Candidatus Binatia bacterium]
MVFLALALPHGALAAELLDIIDGQRQHLGGPEAGMEHELHQATIAVSHEVAGIGACQKGDDLGAGEHGGQAARTGHGTVPFFCRGRLDKSSENRSLLWCLIVNTRQHFTDSPLSPRQGLLIARLDHRGSGFGIHLRRFEFRM